MPAVTAPVAEEKPSRRDRTSAVDVVAALTIAAIVLIVQAGGLLTVPLSTAGLVWPFHLAVLLLALTTARLRRPSPAVAAFVLTWALLWAWMPRSLSVAPDAGWAAREAEALGYSVALSTAALLAGRRAGPHWWRVGWLAGLLLTGAIGVWELTTNQHLFVTERRPWPFRGTVAAATYINPNNFGIVLLSMLVAVLAWRASTRRPGVRWALTGAAVFTTAMVLASQSRAAALGLVVVVVLEARRVSRAHPGVVRGALDRHRRAVMTVAGAGLAALVATFVVPSLAARNPVSRMVATAFAPETGTADLLRVQLIRVALRYGRQSNFLGTGAGSFEPMMWNDPHSGIAIEANLHNTFVEVLVQYGWIVTTPLVVAVGLVLAATHRARLSASLRPRIGVLRTETLGHLVVFVALACTASSSLTMPVWWLILANACVGAAALDDARRLPAMPGPAPRSSEDVAAAL